ncbi:hypothetical protein ABIA45_001768 [Bradyrhizobium sp. USDA 336]
MARKLWAMLVSRATFFGDTDDASFNLEGFGGLPTLNGANHYRLSGRLCTIAAHGCADKAARLICVAGSGFPAPGGFAKPRCPTDCISASCDLSKIAHALAN